MIVAIIALGVFVLWLLAAFTFAPDVERTTLFLTEDERRRQVIGIAERGEAELDAAIKRAIEECP